MRATVGMRKNKLQLSSDVLNPIQTFSLKNTPKGYQSTSKILYRTTKLNSYDLKEFAKERLGSHRTALRKSQGKKSTKSTSNSCPKSKVLSKIGKSELDELRKKLKKQNSKKKSLRISMNSCSYSNIQKLISSQKKGDGNAKSRDKDLSVIKPSVGKKKSAEFQRNAPVVKTLEIITPREKKENISLKKGNIDASLKSSLFKKLKGSIGLISFAALKKKPQFFSSPKAKGSNNIEKSLSSRCVQRDSTRRNFSKSISNGLKDEALKTFGSRTRNVNRSNIKVSNKLSLLKKCLNKHKANPTERLHVWVISVSPNEVIQEFDRKTAFQQIKCLQRLEASEHNNTIIFIQQNRSNLKKSRAKIMKNVSEDAYHAIINYPSSGEPMLLPQRKEWKLKQVVHGIFLVHLYQLSPMYCHEEKEIAFNKNNMRMRLSSKKSKPLNMEYNFKFNEAEDRRVFLRAINGLAMRDEDFNSISSDALTMSPRGSIKFLNFVFESIQSAEDSRKLESKSSRSLYFESGNLEQDSSSMA